MEVHVGSAFVGMGALKRPRSNRSRRPRHDTNFVVEGRETAPSSTPSTGNGGKISSDENVCHESGFRRREFHLNSSSANVSSADRTDYAGPSKRIKKDLDGLYRSSNSKTGLPGGNEQERNGSDLKRSSEGVLSPANCKEAGGAVVPSENKLRKVKLKVGGIMHTIHANLESGKGVDSSSKAPHTSVVPRHPQKLILTENSDDDHLALERGNGSKRSSLKYVQGGISNGLKDRSRNKITEEKVSLQQTEKSLVAQSYEPTRKSKRVRKKRNLDGEFDDANEDKIHCVEGQRTSMPVNGNGPDHEGDGEHSLKRKQLKSSKSRKAGYDVDADYAEGDDPGSDAGSDRQKKKHKEYVEIPTDSRVEPLTTRQRALKSSKGDGVGASLIEFPNGLPPASSRKKKAKLSEIELQAKKAEAAQRRKQQVEKANRDLQAATISKILGYDPEKKRKEEEKLKNLEAKAQEKGVLPKLLPSAVRWVMGPTGTVVTFGEGLGLPSMFGSKPCSYPPPRERCAGPSCTNPYKYRDSKSNLPLCSLQCYKAVQGCSSQQIES